MSNYVKIATIGPTQPQVPIDMEPQEIVCFMIDFWRRKFEQVLPDKPDLIVVPEICDRPDMIGFSPERLLEYYQVRKNQIYDFFARIAREHNCYLVYSAVREKGDGTWLNSSVVIDRTGSIVGIYSKNHVVITEITEDGILCGKDAPIIECDFGRVVCVICFDLNFDQLRLKYVQAKPDLIIYSSVAHGGDLLQGYWAYSCRSHFVASIANLPSQIRNPFGEVMAGSTNYFDYVVATVNLDCCLAHLGYNKEKLAALKAKHGQKVEIYDPGYMGPVLITSNTDDISAVEMAKEFEIELLDAYFARSLAHHANPDNIEK